MNVDVTVVIPAFNSALLIVRCLESVFRQSYTGNVEVIIVDDGSTDQTADIVQRLFGEKVKYIYQPNAGVSSARNNGIKHATGKYIAFLDSDDFWHEHFLSRTVDFLNHHPECVAVNVSQCHVTVSGRSYTIIPENKEAVLTDFFLYWGKYNHVCTGSVLLKTEIAKGVGGQREDLLVCEDLEFWALLATQGKWGVIPDVLFTSDGAKVTATMGWINKMSRRWDSAPSLHEWEKRIISGFNNDIPYAYEYARGRIASILCYCHILSNREELAREQVITYGKFFPASIKNKFLLLISQSSFLWRILCILIRYKEYHRKLPR